MCRGDVPLLFDAKRPEPLAPHKTLIGLCSEATAADQLQPHTNGQDQAGMALEVLERLDQLSSCRFCGSAQDTDEGGEMLAACGCRGAASLAHQRCLVRRLAHNVRSGSTDPGRCKECGCGFSLPPAALELLLLRWQADRGSLRQRALKWQQHATQLARQLPGGDSSSGASSSSTSLHTDFEWV